MSLDGVFETINSLKEESLEKLIELVKIPSISAQDKGIECADALIDIMKSEIEFETQKVPTSGYPVVYAEKMVGAEKTLIFSSIVSPEMASMIEANSLLISTHQ